MIPVKILVIILLVGAVTKFGHPIRAAIVLGLIAGGLNIAGGAALPAAGLQAAASFVVGAVVFWLIDRTQSILLGTAVTILGVAALILFS